MTYGIGMADSYAVQVIKLGGQEAEDQLFLTRLARMIAKSRQLPVIVHGGGKSITRVLTDLGITSQFQHGQRITDAKTMEVVEMVLSGPANKRLVRALESEGVSACGLSGSDAGLIRCIPLNEHLGRVGKPSHINTPILWHLLSLGIVPVIAPIGLGHDGLPYNINADYAAAALAVAMRAEKLTFLTNVPGVLHDGVVTEHLSIDEATERIGDGSISGGMIPKVESALEAVSIGVSLVQICNLDTFEFGGTIISPKTSSNSHLAREGYTDATIPY